MKSIKSIACRQVLGMLLTISATAAWAIEPQLVSVTELKEILAHEPGDFAVQFTSPDPSCGYCRVSNADLPTRLDTDGWKGRFLRVQWSPWSTFPADLSSVPGLGQMPGGVPFLLVYRDSKLAGQVMGHAGAAVDALLQRLGSSAPATATGAPVASIASLALTPATTKAMYGATLSLHPAALDKTGKPVFAANTLVWTSSDPTVARVDAIGHVHLLKRGVATITVSSAKAAAHSEVTVMGFTELAGTNADRACALPDDRVQIYCWGKNLWTIPMTHAGPIGDVHAPVPIARGTLHADVRISKVSIGTFASCALSTDGRIYCWGNSQESTPLARGPAGPAKQGSQAEPPAEIVRGEAPAGIQFRAVAVGSRTACGAANNHQIYCWGDGAAIAREPAQRLNGNVTAPVAMARGELPTNADITDIALSTNGGCALADGEIYCWTGSTLPTTVPLGERPANDRFVHVDSDDFTCALTADGSAYCRGTALGARFGNGTADFLVSEAWRAVQTQAAGGFTVLSQGGIAGATCGIDHDGASWCWGKAHLGSAGNGQLEDHAVLIPSRVQRGEIPVGVKLVGISCGEYHCIALGDDGRLYAWGSNQGYVLGRDSPNFSASAVPIVVAAPLP